MNVEPSVFTTTPHAAVARLGTLLGARRWSLATAESCTGGWLAKILTDFPGASAWFNCGFVTYSAAAKRSVLAVPAALLDAHGVVSEPVAGAMAVGALQRGAAQLAVAITGIAGPDGGTVSTPVGTVCLAWAQSAAPDQAPLIRTTTAHFSGARRAIRWHSVMRAVAGLLDLLTNADDPR